MIRAALLLAGALAASALAGCTTVPVVPQAPGCEVPADLMVACARPSPVPAGITYGDLLKQDLADRRSLEECAAHHRALVDLVGQCKSVLEQYNANITAKGAPPAR